MNALPNLGEVEPLPVQPYHLPALTENLPPVFLLKTEWHDKAPSGQCLPIATDGVQSTVEDAKGRIPGGQQSTLIQRIGLDDERQL